MRFPVIDGRRLRLSIPGVDAPFAGRLDAKLQHFRLGEKRGQRVRTR
jgi:hypothetical protein